MTYTELDTKNRKPHHRHASNDLVVMGNIATVVPIFVRANAAGTAPEFALSASGPWYDGDIWWQAPQKSEFGLFIQFVLQPTVTSVDCDVPLIYASLDKATTSQLCGVPALPAGSLGKEYPFFVTFPNHKRHDPKIIVTPLPGDGD